MGMSVNTNAAAMNAYRNLSVTNNQMSKSLERLSSGFRINRAADDAAGLAISEGLRSQIGGMTQAVRNTQDGISVAQTAEGALNETTSLLQRMRDLSVQAANDGSLNGDAKASIQKELTELKSELTRISETTNFNGTKLLDGTFTDKKFQVGASANESIEVDIAGGASALQLGVDNIDVTSVASWSMDAETIDYTGTAPTGTDTFTLSFDGGTAVSIALTDVAAGWDTGTDAAAAKANRELYQKAADTALAGSGMTLEFGEFGDVKITAASKALNVAGTAYATTVTGDLTIGGTDTRLSAATSTFNVQTGAEGASAAISALDDAIKTVSALRADLGAKQNRFEHTINNLNVAIENTTASESRIRDTDMAQEMTNFTRTQILTQAGTSMLAQANQASQGILKLLG